MTNSTKILLKEKGDSSLLLKISDKVKSRMFINRLNFINLNPLCGLDNIEISKFKEVDNLTDYYVENDTIFFAEANPWDNSVMDSKSKTLTLFLNKWHDTNNKTKRVLITHKECNDGLGSAWSVVSGTEAPVKVIYLDYGLKDFDKNIEVLKGALVIACDFSFKKELHEKVSSICDFFVIDHHESPIAYLEEFDNAIIDKRNSGAVLAYYAMHSNKNSNLDTTNNASVDGQISTVVNKLPAALKLIEDRDLFNHFYGEYTDAFMYYLLDSGIDGLKSVMDITLSMEELKIEIESYDDGACIKKVRKLREELTHKAKIRTPFTFNTIDIVGTNVEGKVSDLLNIMSKVSGTPSFSYAFKSNTNVRDDIHLETFLEFSFRNYKDDISVEEIAMYLGGGGHRQASGAIVNIKSLLIKSFFKGNIIVKYKMSKKVMNLVKEMIQFSDPTSPCLSKDLNSCNMMVTNLDIYKILKHYNKNLNEIFEITKDKDNILHLKIKYLERNGGCYITDRNISVWDIKDAN